MFSVEAIYDGTTFTPVQPVDVKGEYRVVITFLEPVNNMGNPRALRGAAFDLNPTPGKRPVSELFGKFKGNIWMSDDFCEPLEEMKEYME